MPRPANTPDATHHALDSDFVRDQLVQRTVDLNGKRHNPEGEYVLYWMQSTQRLDENWALRAAIRAADKFGRPLVVHQSLDSAYPHSSDRHHAFIVQGARDTARRARELGLHYQFVLHRGRDFDAHHVHRLATRAYLVFTDLFPTAGVRERSERFAERVGCRVLAVDSFCTVPSGLFPSAEYAARTIRPKIARALAHSVERVADHPPRHDVSATLAATLHETLQVEPLPWLDIDNGAAPSSDSEREHHTFDTHLSEELARCEIDHTVAPVRTRGGSSAARAQLQRFAESGALARYASQQNEASNPDSTSGLSPWLHHGQIASAEVVRAALHSGAPADSIDAFLQQVTTWRELSYNWCLRTRDFDSIASLPAWVQRSMAAHERDERPVLQDLATLAKAATGDALWNAAQRQLLQSGVIHNYPRMLWGKTLLLWTPTYEQALRAAFHLNDKWALDGQDPNSVGGIMWCFGLWDRPWGDKPVWGGIRPMVTARARYKFDVAAYIRSWSAPASE